MQKTKTLHYCLLLFALSAVVFYEAFDTLTFSKLLVFAEKKQQKQTRCIREVKEKHISYKSLDTRLTVEQFWDSKSMIRMRWLLVSATYKSFLFGCSARPPGSLN